MKPLTARSHPPYGPAQLEVTRQVKASVARGEIACLVFSLISGVFVEDLRLFPTPLTSSEAGSSKLEADLFVVNKWPQAGVGVFQAPAIEVRELLLKDDREPLRDGYIRGCGAFQDRKSTRLNSSH